MVNDSNLKTLNVLDSLGRKHGTVTSAMLEKQSPLHPKTLWEHRRKLEAAGYISQSVTSIPPGEKSCGRITTIVVDGRKTRAGLCRTPVPKSASEVPLSGETNSPSKSISGSETSGLKFPEITCPADSSRCGRDPSELEALSEEIANLRKLITEKETPEGEPTRFPAGEVLPKLLFPEKGRSFNTTPIGLLTTLLRLLQSLFLLKERKAPKLLLDPVKILLQEVLESEILSRISRGLPPVPEITFCPGRGVESPSPAPEENPERSRVYARKGKEVLERLEPEAIEHSKYKGYGDPSFTPYKRTMEFWYLYQDRAWKVNPNLKKTVSKVSFRRTRQFQFAERGRIQADKLGARYEDYLDAIFAYHAEHNSETGYPMIYQTYEERAQEHYTLWYSKKYYLRVRDYREPAFKASEYNPKRPWMVEYYDEMVRDAGRLATVMAGTTMDTVEDLVTQIVWELIQTRTMAWEYLEKYEPKLATEVRRYGEEMLRLQENCF